MERRVCQNSIAYALDPELREFKAERALLRRAGFAPWGKDSWVHDAEGCVQVYTTEEALEMAFNEDEPKGFGE